MRRTVLAALTILVMLSPPASHAAAAKTLRIVVKDLAYRDVPATAHVGDTLEWVNEDILDHTATASDGSFDVRLRQDRTARTVLKKPGKIAFYCRYHPNMKGEIDVKP